VALGDTIHVPIRLSNVGTVRAISVRLAWNPTKVRPLGTVAGDMLTLPRRPVLAAAGHGGRGIPGCERGEPRRCPRHHELRHDRPGDPGIRIESVDARDATTSPSPSGGRGRPARRGAERDRDGARRAEPLPGLDDAGVRPVQASRVQMAIFSVDGRLVRTLIGRRSRGRPIPSGVGRRDAHGSHAAPGVYYVRFVAGSQRFTRQVVLLQ
jgi:hypothetical protein